MVERLLSLSKKDKGILIRYLCKVTGYSRQQMTRLIKQYRKKGRLGQRPKNHEVFFKGFTPGKTKYC